MNWTSEMQDATPAQFKKMIAGWRKDQNVKNAIKAGRSLEKLLLDNKVTLLGVDDVQLERYRRRYQVHKNLVGVMYAVATGKLTDDLLNERLDNRFPSSRLASGKIRLTKRCDLCGRKSMCRCFLENAKMPRGVSYEMR